MPKFTPHRLEATDYVRLSELPALQANSLLNWLPESYFTKLETGETFADDCIEYEDYEFWYEYSRKDETLLDEQL